MSASSRSPRSFFAVLLFSALSIHVSFADGAPGDYSNYEDLDEAVLSCEEAVSALAECCPGFHAHTVRCVDHRYRHTSDCNGTVSEGHERPEIDTVQSRCIRAASCDDLLRTGTCERAIARFPTLRPDAGLPTASEGACL
jgi:hypothetical protein